MRCANRNKQPFWYALYDKTAEEHNAMGYEVGAHATYRAPVKAYGNIAPVTGTAVAQPFGYNDQYDTVIVVEDPNTPIDETAVLWIGPVDSNEPWTNEDWETITNEDGVPIKFFAEHPWNHIVKRVSRGLQISGCAVIYASRVNVS